MKIAVIGAGIAGLACASKLSRRHAVTLYEANGYLGGHTHTVDVTLDGIEHPVDTGFLVFNHRTYPNLVRLFADLDVATAPSEMSFSVRLEDARGGALEWAGTSLDSVFAQRRNLLRPSFLQMLSDIVRFNRLATGLAESGASAMSGVSLGQFLDRHRFSRPFRDGYLLPMAGAIWSCPAAQMCEFPVATFIHFCHNHGLLQISRRPPWFTVIGGGREYVKKLAATIGTVRLSAVERVARGADDDDGVEVTSAHTRERYDEVVLACHSDQALRLLADPSDGERAVLGAIRYQPNLAVLHTDSSVLPEARRAWAAWNYHSAPADPARPAMGPAVHYLINRLQPLPFRQPVLVSLNPLRPPRADAVVSRFEYSHPVFDDGAIRAQGHLESLQGRRHTWFAGAWTGYGFHEDGLKSGLTVAERIELQALQPALASA